MLALCLMLLVTYHALNYAGIFGLGLIKSNIYKAMVRPIMEYSSTIWDPHTSVNINRVESIQRYAARMCFRNYSRYSSVTSMLAELNLPTLEERGIRAKLQLFYKIIYHLRSNHPR